MSNYNGRRGPNVSQFLRNLTATSPHDQVDDESPYDDLSMFTTTEFFDLDSAQNTDYRAQPVKIDTAAPTPALTANDDPISTSSVVGDISSSLEFMSGDYPFNDSSAYPAAPLGFFGEEPHTSFQPLQPNHSHNHVYPNQIAPAQQQQQTQQPQQQPLAPQFAQSGPYPRAAADKRKADDLEPSNSPHSFEESSRAAAEEDKRRRNTAASARFRIKKKQREQALEKSAKDMSEKVSTLESKVSQLETENKWLKNLLTDKNGGSEEINILWKEFTKHASQRQQAKADSAKAADRS